MLEDHCDTSLLLQITRQTPVHWAAEYGHIKMVKLLHQHGADLSLRDMVSVTCALTVSVLLTTALIFSYTDLCIRTYC